VLKPRAYLPVHWDGLWNPLLAGVQQPYADPPLEALLKSSGVQLVRPAQYLDKWRLDVTGIHAIANDQARQSLGIAPQ
jgi:hypothetical protein